MRYLIQSVTKATTNRGVAMIIQRNKSIEVHSPVWIDRKTQSTVLMKKNWVPKWFWNILGACVTFKLFMNIFCIHLERDEWESILGWVSDAELGRLCWESRNMNYNRFLYPWARVRFTLCKERPVSYFPRWPLV